MDDRAHIEPDRGAAERFGRFVGLIARLRAPDGCPWDRKQTHASIARNMIEEAHEAVDAINRGDVDDLRDELGDVLLEVVLQAQIAADEGEFSIDDVIDAVDAKMMRRHPHVFGTEAAFAALGVSADDIKDADDVAGLWDQVKLIEKRQADEARRAKVIAAGEDPDAAPGMLDDIPTSLPALIQAQNIIRKAAAAGFFWADDDGVWDKVGEEAGEFKEALGALDGAQDADSARAHAHEELGDLLFTLTCLAHAHGLDGETALTQACSKFRRRWSIIEREARGQGRRAEDMTLEEQDALWERAKCEERGL